MFMMEYPETQAAVAQVLWMKNKPLLDMPVSKTASSEEALQFVRSLHEEYVRRGRPLNVPEFIEEYLDRFNRGELRGIGRRILMDILKRPQIAAEEGPEPEPPLSVTRRRNAAKPGPKRSAAAGQRGVIGSEARHWREGVR
jgi:hypothetical protein